MRRNNAGVDTVRQDGKWDFWIDRGGTFTDIVARCPDGTLRTHKLLSENPEQYSDAAMQGVRDLLDIAGDQPVPRDKIANIRMGTTVATNALLERKGDRTLLVTTAGFADGLRIGYQNRPKLFDLNIELPQLLYERVVEVDERIRADGTLERALNLSTARRDLQAAFDDGIRAVAIVLMHGYRYTQHEKAVAVLAREIGFPQISVSHEVSALIKFVGRGDTTVVDAYLSPILRRYVDRIAAELQTDDGGQCRLMFMQSNGGLTDARLFQGKDSILSGPAGGVVGAARTSERAGFDKIIGFDMGGTSTDVSHFDGEYERAFETLVAGVRMRAPMMRIHTVAAGGGSILHYDGARMRVGPDSAGANPGPASYRRGGPLTVTDANVVTGKLRPEFFPPVFGPHADRPLDADAARQKFQALADEIDGSRSPEEVADGFIAIAVENMAQAIKKISVQRGYDVTEYTLTCFGGAAGQHACRVADALAMRRIFLHPFAGVLSAFGMGLADIRAHREQSVELPLAEESLPSVRGILNVLEQETAREVAAQGISADRVHTFGHLHLRVRGTDTALAVPVAGVQEMRTAFDAAHTRYFGFGVADRDLVIDSISVEAVGGEDHEPSVMPSGVARATPEGGRAVRFFSLGQWQDGTLVPRDSLAPGEPAYGPAIITEPHGTIIVEAGWRATLAEDGCLILERHEALPERFAIGTEADPVMLEIFNNLFMSIAEQMGATLEKTAHSVNIKERLDFSCALFDVDGNLIANAPHMPVHLGSMSESVRTVIRRNRDAMAPGDVYVLNAPYGGGTHLPDVTVVTPMFGKAGDGQEQVLFYVASRGHHADIGGVSPGSMPPQSTDVNEEGVLIDNFKLVDGGRFREAQIMALLTGGPYPARNPAQNIADLKAQIAACEKGVQELAKMIGHFSLDVVRAYTGHVQDNAEEAVRRVIDRLPDADFSCSMDNGAVIRVSVRGDRQNRSARIDFTGTSAQLPNNFNAPFSVCRAAVLYVFRCMVDDDIPLNEGCLKPLEIIVPEGSMLRPQYPAAVVAGNVETSQAVTDALFGAFGVMAAAQGTMNNLTFGNAEHQYYETIAGGSGAGPTFDGASAVQTHMTNSRLTDPEILEQRFPVLLESFAIRRGSGGKGRHVGGDGVVRTIRFLGPMSAAILSTRRQVPPFGLAGGEDGKPGRNRVKRAGGAVEELPGCARVEVSSGDRLVIETPGGGGYGPVV